MKKIDDCKIKRFFLKVLSDHLAVKKLNWRNHKIRGVSRNEGPSDFFEPFFNLTEILHENI